MQTYSVDTQKNNETVLLGTHTMFCLSKDFLAYDMECQDAT